MKHPSRIQLILILLIAIGFTACNGSEQKEKAKDNLAPKDMEMIQGEEVAVLTDPPNVPPPIERDYPTKVIVNMDIIEHEKELTDGVSYTFWTFGGTVPGSFIRIREGDQVEFHLRNHPDNKLPHNIDLHAVTGPGGGAAASFTAPGHESIFEFKALNPGLYIYHCATAPVGMHIANGMYGLILVEPKEGLPKVDREFYVVQGEFYTSGRFGDQGLQPFSMQRALNENPEYVVFNGNVHALTGSNELKAKVGETIRIFIGNGGPNLTSSFHVIGEIFDNVRVEGGDMVNTNVQTTLVPAGGAAIVEFRAEAPGALHMVDHAIFRAFNKGALGTILIEGEENLLVYSGKQDDRIYLPEGGIVQDMPGDEPKEVTAATKEERIRMGGNVYSQVCQACHQADGGGLPSAFPPLANSDYLNADVNRSIRAVVKGLQGEITVNGEKYNSVMPSQNLSNEEIANVMTYVYNNWGNNGTVVTPEQVAAVR